LLAGARLKTAPQSETMQSETMQSETMQSETMQSETMRVRQVSRSRQSALSEMFTAFKNSTVRDFVKVAKSRSFPLA
jgi:hypothetical protein